MSKASKMTMAARKGQIPKDDLQGHIRATLNHIYVHTYRRRNHAHSYDQDDDHPKPDWS